MSGIHTVYDWHEAHEADLTVLHVPPSPANNHYSWHVAVDMPYYTLKGWGGASELQARNHKCTRVHKYTSARGQERSSCIHTQCLHMTAHERPHSTPLCLMAIAWSWCDVTTPTMHITAHLSDNCTRVGVKYCSKLSCTSFDSGHCSMGGGGGGGEYVVSCGMLIPLTSTATSYM